MARKSVMLDVDTRLFRKQLGAIQRKFDPAMKTEMQRLAAYGEDYARSMLFYQVYGTRETPNYRRSGRLMESIEGTVTRIRPGEWTISIGAKAPYASFVELGVRDKFVLPQEILRKARTVNDVLILITYGDPSDPRTYPRPFLLPTLVHLERVAEAYLVRAVRAALT